MRMSLRSRLDGRDSRISIAQEVHRIVSIAHSRIVSQLRIGAKRPRAIELTRGEMRRCQNLIGHLSSLHPLFQGARHTEDVRAFASAAVSPPLSDTLPEYVDGAELALDPLQRGLQPGRSIPSGFQFRKHRLVYCVATSQHCGSSPCFGYSECNATANSAIAASTMSTRRVRSNNARFFIRPFPR
jgi:hypothetical protein